MVNFVLDTSSIIPEARLNVLLYHCTIQGWNQALAIRDYASKHSTGESLCQQHLQNFRVFIFKQLKHIISEL